jgi:hypothetical protein
VDPSVQSCLGRLAPHLDRRRVALTGGLAVALHLVPGERWAPGTERLARDVDFVAEAVDTVAPTVAEEFLVSHFHLPEPGYAKFIVQLVDPVTRLRIDVFPDSLSGLARARRHAASGVPFLVLEPQSILDHKLELLARSSPRVPIEEKHYRDAELLATLCGQRPPERPPFGFAHAVYSQDLTAVCPRCAVSADPRFPLAPKRQVHDILGYV